MFTLQDGSKERSSALPTSKLKMWAVAIKQKHKKKQKLKKIVNYIINI